MIERDGSKMDMPRSNNRFQAMGDLVLRMIVSNTGI